MISDKDPRQLLALCNEARRAGRDFPTIWLTLLEKHPLVAGLPRHEIRDGQTLIVVRLLNGQALSSSTRGFVLD
ncbi:MAG: hypothetical protein ABL871_11670 [Terricaulis sp.]